MKFGITKQPKTFYKNTEKSLNAKKNNYKELSSIEGRNVNTSLCYDRTKSFITLQNWSRRYGVARGPCPPVWLTKNTFFGTSCNDRRSKHATTGVATMQIKIALLSSISSKYLNV